jgi:hypothetical protein
MQYKTIKKEFPEFKHEEHMHELREKHKENEKKMTKHLMGENQNKLEIDYD